MGFLGSLLKKRTGEELCTVLLAAAVPPPPRSELLQLELVNSTFERENLDVRFGRDVNRGSAHLRVLLSDPGANVGQRTSAIVEATKLVRELMAAGASGVVVHRAGEVLFSAPEFLRRTQRFGEPGWFPTLAWMDVGRAEGVALTYGLQSFGLPEVAVVDQVFGPLDDDEIWAREQEGLMASACTMVSRGTALATKERLLIHAGMEFSGGDFAHDNPGMQELAAAADLLGWWVIEVIDDMLVRARPALTTGQSEEQRYASGQSRGCIAYPTYRWLFLEWMRRRGFRKIASLRPPSPPETPVFEVLVFEHSDGGRFVTSTCGLARVPQAGGTPEHHNAFIEFAVELPVHSPRIATALTSLALMVHLKDPGAEPIGPLHRAQAFGTDFPYEWVVYDALSPIEIPGANPIELLQPLFMTRSEREATPLGANGEWIERNRETALTRWQEQPTRN